MEEFQLNTKIVSGPGAIGVLGQEKARRVFLVTDPFFVKNGMADRVVRAAGAESWEIFDGVQPDPSVDLAARGTARLKAFGPDLLIALGGGSAMDCAKAMAYFSGTDAPLAAIPTTSGSGSEVTDFAVLTHGQTKYPLVDKRLQPALAILDSDLLDELPPGLIADTGFDVLTHAVEGYTASNAGTIPDLLAQDAFRTAFACLPASYAGDKSVRLRLHMASTLAGIAFSRSGLGLCHAMAHVLGGRFHIPHGRLNAILLPAVISGNAPAAQAKYARLARRSWGQRRHRRPAESEKRSYPAAEGPGAAPDPLPGRSPARPGLGRHRGDRGSGTGRPLLQDQPRARGGLSGPPGAGGGDREFLS